MSLSADGRIATVGAGRASFGGEQRGAVYAFERSGSSYSNQTKLGPENPAAFENFASDLELSSDGPTALVGAFHTSEPNGDCAGAAYVSGEVRELSTTPEDGPTTDGSSGATDGGSKTTAQSTATAATGTTEGDEDDGTETSGSGPEFDVTGALASIAGAGYLAKRRLDEDRGFFRAFPLDRGQYVPLILFMLAVYRCDCPKSGGRYRNDRQ